MRRYDSADPAVVVEHVDWAREAGINTFVVDACIPHKDQWWMNRNTLPMIDVFDAEGLSYFFCADGWFEFLGADAGGYVTQAIAAHVNASLSHSAAVALAGVSMKGSGACLRRMLRCLGSP